MRISATGYIITALLMMYPALVFSVEIKDYSRNIVAPSSAPVNKLIDLKTFRPKAPVISKETVKPSTPTVKEAAETTVEASTPVITDLPASEKRFTDPHENQIRTLLEMLNDEAWPARAIAANELGEIGRPEHVPALKKLLHDRNDDVRQAASDAIYKLEKLAKQKRNQRF